MNTNAIAQWVEGCRRKDRKSQESLYRHFYPVAYRICQRYCQDDGETDIVLNDGFLKVFLKIHQYNAELGAAEAWIRTIITRTAIDYVRSRNRHAFRTTYLEHAEDLPDQAPAISEASPEVLLGAIRTLPVTTRTVLNLHLFEDQSHKQIAGLLGITESTSRWHLTEARKKLRQYFSDKDFLTGVPKTKSVIP